MRPESAARAFAQAIALDQAAPLPRIGLGLALIQRGRLADGRRQLEIAVILDPTDALVRSYMAKVYDAEHRTELAATQLQLAKAFNPDDPTPWLYDAAHKYSENRPIDALRDLRTAIDLNDDRAVYRSRLRVDEDLAARSAAWGSLHRELNFEALALAQGWKSIARDPTDYTGHRLLADVYSTRPRHEIARVNELFQSQLLQPINLTPIQPQLAEVSEFISDSVGPSELAMGEFSPLLSRNGLKFRGSAVLGDHATRGEDIVVAGLHDRISYSVGQFSFETDGFRRNNDLEQRVGNAFVQFRPSHATSLQAELRASEAHKGDLSMLFDRAEFSPTLRQDESVDSVRLGLRRELSDRATLLSSLIYHDVEVVTTSGPLFSRTTDVGGYSVDVQHVYRASRWHTSAGFVYSSQDRLDVTTLAAPLPSQPAAGQSSSEAGSDLQQESAYVYATLAVQPRLDITIGASADRVATVGLQGSRLNPKLGMLWEPTDRTTVRAAAFKTLQGPLVSKRNIQPRLEPVHVAGFNQLFFGADAERASRYGAAIDHQFSAALFGGAEISTRKLDVPLRIFVPPSTTETLISVAADEYLRRAYLNWAPTARFSFSAEYEAEKFDNGGELLNGFTTMQLRRLPLELRYFHPLGVTAGLRASHIRQDGRFGGLSFGPGSPIELGEDDFWVFDASLGYRLPDRRGLLSLNIHNLFDQEFRFQDTDPENPRVLPERMVSFRFTLAFQ
jgi:tetratricopeptide (TPR) repeat protein